jgi:hypothetical protein
VKSQDTQSTIQSTSTGKHIQGWGTYFQKVKYSKGERKRKDPVEVSVLAIHNSGLCTVLFPDGKQKVVAFSSISDFKAS